MSQRNRGEQRGRDGDKPNPYRLFLGILIDLFEPRGRDFGDPPHVNIRVKIERITASYKDEKLNAWRSYTSGVGFITIDPDGKLEFSSARLKSEMFRLGLEIPQQPATVGTTEYVPQPYLGHGPHYNVRREKKGGES